MQLHSLSLRRFVFTFAISTSALSACAPSTEKVTPSLQQLGSHQPARVLNATVLGPVARDRVISFVVGVQLRDRNGFEQFLKRQVDRSSADYGKVYTPASFADAFAISQADYDAFATHLGQLGLTVTRTSPSRSTITVQGPAATVEQVFGTDLLEFEDSKTTAAVRHATQTHFFAPSARFSLAALAEHATLVAGITGLDDADQWESHLLPPGSNAPTPDALPGVADPSDIRTIYNVTGALNGSGTQVSGAGETVALLGTGFAPAATDLAGFVKAYGLPDYTTHYTQVFLGGANRDPENLANIELGENVLDADMVLGVAPAADIVHVFVAGNAGGLFSDGISFIINEVPQAHTVSVSYGTCERGSITEALQLDAVFMQAQAQGQNWFFATGDHGTDTCEDSSTTGVPAVDSPADDPYVIGVGGTQIIKGVEEAWGVAGGGTFGGGGGGQSELFVKPAYQDGVGPFPTDGVRDLPDVSALAGDPGLAVYQGGLTSAEGTSAASPMWAAIWSMMLEAHNHVPMPAAHENIYAAGKAGLGFHDVTVGNNSDGTTPGFNAVAGYDLATGWGSPNLTQLIGALP